MILDSSGIETFSFLSWLLLIVVDAVLLDLFEIRNLFRTMRIPFANMNTSTSVSTDPRGWLSRN